MTAALQQSLAETIHDAGVTARPAHRPRRREAVPSPARPGIDGGQIVNHDGASARGSSAVRHGLWRAPGGPSAADPSVRQGSTDDVDNQARLIAHGIIEVLAGQRPQQQLEHLCAHAVYTALSRARRPTATIPHLISVRVCEPVDGVIEATAVYRRGRSVRLLAYRLERRDPSPGGLPGSWHTTAIHLA